jgi:excisionase family DNA binding protein
MAATYTVKQVAEILSYSTNSIYTFLKAKRIKGVRVGKGRFRIPQSELNRLLLITKRTTPPPQNEEIMPVSGTAMIPGDIGIIDSREYIPFSVRLLGRVHVVTANIFDWFIGIAAIVSGTALFPFNQSFNITDVTSVMPLLPAIRILLVGGGVGILLTNLFYDSHRVWHRIFHGVLALAVLGMTILLFQTFDIDGVGIYSTLTFVIGLTIFFHMDRLAAFVLYLTLLALVAPLVAFTAPADFHVVAFAAALHMPPFIMGIGLSVVSTGFIYFIWRGYWRDKKLFWMCSYIGAFVFFSMGFWYAQHQYWSRAFYFLVIGLTSMYLPSWEDLSVIKNKKAHTLAVGIFGSILALLLVGVTVVYVTQLNVISTVKKENAQKVDFARTEVETEIQSVKSIITTAAINPDLIRATAYPDIPTLTNLSRIMFDSSDSIRRFIFLDRNGQAVFLYPLGTFDQTDLSFRDYFIQPRDTGKLYISDIFEALADNSHRKVVTISAPLFTTDKEFVGVLGASLDLDAISARLQKIAAVDRGEYIVVLDSNGKRIMHPASSLIGTDTEPDDPALLGIQGKQGTAEGDTYNGIHALISYNTVAPLHWAIALKAPFNQIYELSSTANLLVAGLLIGCIFIAVFIFQLAYMYRYKSPGNNGGSP